VNRNGDTKDLRARAEALLKGGDASAGTDPAESLRLVHELQVHQIELEMQNAALRQAREDLEAARDQYVNLYEFAPVGYLTLATDGRIIGINLTGATLLRDTRNRILNRPILTYVAPASQARWHLDFQQALRASWQQTIELALVRADGSEFDAQLDYLPMPTDAAAMQLRIALTDISARKAAEKQQQLAASVFTHANEGIMITQADGEIIEVNAAFTDITGYRRDEVIGQNPRILSSGRQDPSFYSEMWRMLIETGMWSGEIWNRRKNGEIYAGMQTISAVRDAQGQALHYVALITDITERKETQLKLERLAHFDALTGLPNRVLLADRLHQAMVQTERRGLNLAVVYLDLDGFKEINDRHGHEVGDRLLATLAKRMKHTLREGDTLARLGGDEFVAVLPELADIETSEPMLVRLLAAAAESVRDGELSLQVSASAGVSFYPQADAVDADQLLRQADQAMYQAKLAGKNRYHMFDTEQDRNLRGHHESLERIRVALAAREFVLHYQPKVNMRTGRVVGVEALIRWQHPQRGLLPPAKFLPEIENHPLAIELGEWVIDEALKQMETWQAAGLKLPVSVNVGAGQLQQPDFVVRLRALLAAHPAVAPDNLALEVLESRALADLIQLARVIDACRKLGVRFALDDFGTGYAALTYLKRLSVTQFKIDQSFVHSMLDDPDDLAILEGVLGLTTAFSCEAIAEGVESREHGELLLQLGCELAQGYFIAHPMPAAQLPGWAATWQTDARWLGVTALRGDDLPILYAEVEHRAWVAALEHALMREAGPLPILDEHQCGFGVWLDANGLAEHADQADFMHIVALHHQLHSLGAELAALHAQGQAARALTRLDELHALRDDFLEKLRNRLLAGSDDRRHGRPGETVDALPAGVG
jgi:diguanylate cyclase (GGDEF)-like protein/PAS domain S-box-containing protein